MKNMTQNDINRVYAKFNQAYSDEPERYDFLNISQFCDNDRGIRLEFKDDIAHGYWELYKPHDALLICLAECFYHTDYHQKILPGEDIISIRFVLSGNFSVDFPGIGKFTIPQASASIMYVKENHPFDLTIEEGSHLSSVTFHVKPHFLYEKFGIDKLKTPTHLRDVVFGGELNKHLYNIPLSPQIINNVLDLLRMPYSGTRRRLFTEAKSSELICRLFQEIEDAFEAVPIAETPEYKLKQKLLDAQHILVENFKSPPTINSLARQVGLNRSSLSAEFKELFGMTVFEFCQSYRMNKAKELLEDRNLSISQVASSVGYEHATNFTSAFKKTFGTLPKSIRTL